MNKFEIKKLDNGRFYVNIISTSEDLTLTNGVIVTKSELKTLYIKLIEVFTQLDE